MVPVTLATIMKISKTLTKNMLPGKDQMTIRSGMKVMKLDCIGHVQKRLGKPLYEFQKSSVKLDDGKPMKQRNGRLTKAAIEQLKKYYGKAIRNNVKKDVTTTEERDQAVQLMKNEILAGLFHCLKLPDKERHQYGVNTRKAYLALTSHIILTRCSRNISSRFFDRLTDSALLA